MQIRVAVSIFLFTAITVVAVTQTQPPSDPQALTFAAQSIAALTGGTSVGDVTLTGTATWYGAGTDTGTATLRALGSGESRMDLALTSGTRTELRDAQTGSALGQWLGANNTSGLFAAQNCWTDAVWFFPALGSLAVSQSSVLSYIGQETRNGESVQHLQAYQYVSGQPPSPTPQQLSTQDFYLDAGTLLPVAIDFNAHADNNAGANLSVEIDFFNYQAVSGVAVPFEIQRYQQGSLLADVVITSAVFNTGLSLSIFAIN